ncbi:MAG: DUF456 domain-containing protein [Candidatus Aureabacteria bacterium]|nr:DUF456 domain-containing protein [Candidatus Auribacterota bacterium]
MIVIKIFLIFLCLCGVLLSMMSIGGTFLITFAYLLHGISGKFEDFWYWLTMFTLLLLLSIAGEVLEFFSASIGSKKFGASNISFFTTLIFGILGGIWGTLIFPVIGTLIGTVFAACSAAFITELLLKGNWKVAIKASVGVLAGKTGSMLVKTLLSLFMATFVILSLF